jgi:hypothetical protein
MAIVIRSGGGLERGLVRRRRCREGRGLDSREASEPWLRTGEGGTAGSCICPSISGAVVACMHALHDARASPSTLPRL